MGEKKIVTRMTLKKLDTMLPNFIRIHRSYIVNPDNCQAFNLDNITVGEEEIPVGRTYRQEVSDKF
jgi:DNA-binding LytR/AlgR family response regulator